MSQTQLRPVIPASGGKPVSVSYGNKTLTYRLQRTVYMQPSFTLESGSSFNTERAHGGFRVILHCKIPSSCLTWTSPNGFHNVNAEVWEFWSENFTLRGSASVGFGLNQMRDDEQKKGWGFGFGYLGWEFSSYILSLASLNRLMVCLVLLLKFSMKMRKYSFSPRISILPSYRDRMVRRCW